MAVPDDYSEHLKQRVLGAFGFDSEAELDAATEEALPGYLAAEAEYRAEQEAYLASLPGRVEEARQAVTIQLRAQGVLPDGVELVPMDLEADAHWMTQAPWAQLATPAEPSDVLARIDAAIDDWEDGPDAARWHPHMPETDEVPAPPFAGMLVTLDGEYVRPPRCRCSIVPARLEIPATRRNACESVVELFRALRLEPWPHGWNEPCSCHPKPFPAARDYRRRTRHRNRRRKS